GGRTIEVFGAEDVQRDMLDLELQTPLQEGLELVHPEAVPEAHVQPAGTGETPVAVEDQSDVPRHGGACQLALQMPFVKPVQRAGEGAEQASEARPTDGRRRVRQRWRRQRGV